MRTARLAVPAILLALLALTGRADDDASVALFNGRDLNGWVAEGVTEIKDGDGSRPVWTVEDGKIVCAGNGFGFLRYAKRPFDDFVFHVEYRMEPRGNTGVGIRTRAFDPAESRATRPSIYSYEIQLVDDAGEPPSTHSTGSLYRYVAPSTNPVKPAGEWNTLEVECLGPHIKVSLNGQKIIDVDQSRLDALKDKPLSGHVCIQNHNHHAEFRNIWIRELDGPSPK